MISLSCHNFNVLLAVVFAQKFVFLLKCASYIFMVLGLSSYFGPFSMINISSNILFEYLNFTDHCLIWCFDFNILIWLKMSPLFLFRLLLKVNISFLNLFGIVLSFSIISDFQFHFYCNNQIQNWCCIRETVVLLLYFWLFQTAQ